MHRSLKARFSNSNNSAKKNNCKGMIDRKNNATASFPDFFEVVFVRNVEDTLSYASITARAFLLRSDFDHAVYAADVTWSANFDTHRFPNFPPKTLRLLLREVAIEKSIVHIHGQIDRTTKGEQRRGTQTRNHSFFIRITNIENMGLHSSGEQLP